MRNLLSGIGQHCPALAGIACHWLARAQEDRPSVPLPSKVLRHLCRRVGRTFKLVTPSVTEA